jgi:type IV secretory pathway VirB2 component (pilin)
MKKLIFLGILFILLFFVFSPHVAMADWKIGDPLVPQNPVGPPAGTYGITDFFQMLVNIYSFIVLEIATPLALIALVIGGIFMMLSAGSPNMMATGKKIIWSAIIGLVLVFASYVIVQFILTAVGFQGNWQNPF